MKICAASAGSGEENAGHGDFFHQAYILDITLLELHCSYSLNGKRRAGLKRKKGKLRR